MLNRQNCTAQALPLISAIKDWKNINKSYGLCLFGIFYAFQILLISLLPNHSATKKRS